jgi:hypothetical protein
MKEIKQFSSDGAIKYLVCNKIDKTSNDNTTISSTAWTINEEVKYIILNLK